MICRPPAQHPFRFPLTAPSSSFSLRQHHPCVSRPGITTSHPSSAASTARPRSLHPSSQILFARARLNPSCGHTPQQHSPPPLEPVETRACAPSPYLATLSSPTASGRDHAANPFFTPQAEPRAGGPTVSESSCRQPLAAGDGIVPAWLACWRRAPHECNDHVKQKLKSHECEQPPWPWRQQSLGRRLQDGRQSRYVPSLSRRHALPKGLCYPLRTFLPPLKSAPPHVVCVLFFAMRPFC